GNSPGVRQKLAEGIGSLLGWRKGVRQKKTETRRKIIGDNRPRSNLGIRPSSDDDVVSWWEFARRFAKRIRKLTGNTKGDRREEDRRTYRMNAGGYRIMREINYDRKIITIGIGQDNGPRSSLGIGPSSDDEVVSHREFTRRFIEGIKNLAGNTKGDRREEDRRAYRKNTGGYRIM
ncbi:hypothetical protein BHE74_00053442, partial [Ensete ventricosum]